MPLPLISTSMARIKLHLKDFIKGSSTTRDDHPHPKWKKDPLTSPIHNSTSKIILPKGVITYFIPFLVNSNHG
jgi:hypothetical protein